MRVTIVDRSAMLPWGAPGPGRVVLRTVEIPDTCPVCGGPRGKPVRRPFCEDGEHYSADCWRNPCGHVDTYVYVLREVTA